MHAPEEEQSESVVLVQPAGQQPSELMHWLIDDEEHEAEHVPGLLHVYVMQAVFVPQFEA